MIHQIYKTQSNVEFLCDALIRSHPSSRKIISTQLVEKMLAIGQKGLEKKLFFSGTIEQIDG
jgi:hypothetical protein